jgi:hypothetical protein
MKKLWATGVLRAKAGVGGADGEHEDGGVVVGVEVEVEGVLG